jgi:hypothetical protein
MGRSFFRRFERDDGAEIEVEYQVSPGSPPSFDDPGVGPEVEIFRAWPVDAGKDDPDIILPDEEREQYERTIAENPEWWEDDGPDPDYLRDARMDERLTDADRN